MHNTAHNSQDVPIPDTFTDKIKLLGSCGSQDFKKSGLYGKSILGASLALTAYEWGPGNETLTPIITAAAMDSSQGLGGVALTAAIAGGFTYGEQLFSSFLARKTVMQYPETAKVSFQLMNGAGEHENLKFKPFHELPRAKKFLYSFTIGSSFNVVREAAVRGDTQEKPLRNVGRKSALITGASVAVIAALADTIDQSVPEGNIVRTGIEFLKTPIPWLTFAGLYLTKDYLKSKLSRSSKPKVKPHDL